MPSHILILFLPFITYSLFFHRLSTNGQQQLTKNDYIYSTLGQFRFSLEPKNCQLQIQQFDDSSNRTLFRALGSYPKISKVSCKFLKFNLSGLFTQKGQSFFAFKDDTSTSNNLIQKISNIKQTFMTIDDSGVLRLQSVFLDQSTRQKWITNFRNPQKFILSANNKIIPADSTLSIIKNNGDWGFSASKNQFRVFSTKDNNKISRYKFLPFILSTNIFKDMNDFTTPLVNFDGLKYQKRCGISKQVSFRSPFVFTLNRFWPQLRVLDQQGYELFSMRYPTIHCLRDVGIDEISNGYTDCISWFCPPQLFQLNGRCFAKCPQPYYHQIKENKKNRCVLICQAGSQIDNETKTCSCTRNQDIICPYDLTTVPFGCLCQNKKYFIDKNILSIQNKGQFVLKNRTLDELCLKKCPVKYFEHPQGICVSCPLFCVQCTSFNSSMTYLQCIQCEQGYQLAGGLYCRRKCEFRVGFFMNTMTNKCERCQTRNCKKCQIRNNIQICRQCIIPFALFSPNGTCINNCPNGYIMKFIQQRSFQCLLINNCTNKGFQQKINNVALSCKSCIRQLCFQSCQDTSYYYFHNKSMCYCLERSNFSFIPFCNYTFRVGNSNQSLISYSNYLDKGRNPCNIIHYYYNYKTNQCLECPFGCLTCLINDKGFPQCTSCIDNYYLSIYDNSYCQKQTSLVYCYSFDKDQKYCFLWDDIDQLQKNDHNHQLCKPSDSNCFICLYKSTNYCKFCKNQYYLHEGKCIKECPSGYYPYKYQHVCLPYVVENCILQNIQTINYLIYINSNTQYLQGYRYFTSRSFTQIQNQNDPVGLIFIYSAFLRKKIDGQRMSTFGKGVSSCLTCRQGYGLTRQGKCQKCFPNCQVCIYSYMASCIACHPFYYLTDKKTCLPLQVQKRPCLQNQYRNQYGVCQNQCSQFIRLNWNKNDSNQKLTNCTFNCPYPLMIFKYKNGSLICVQEQFIANNKQLKSNDLNSVEKVSQYPIKILASCYTKSLNSGICLLMPSTLITNLTAQAFQISILKTKSSRLLNNEEFPNNYNKSLILQSESQLKILIQKNVIYLIGIKEGLLKAIFSIQKFYNSDKNQYLNNGLYGYDLGQGKSMLDSIMNNDHGLHHYGRMFVILFFIIAIINIGKGLDYKLDNIFITMGVIYLILPGLNLNIQKGSYNLYGFLYGFAWSLGLQMFSNPRYLTVNHVFFNQNYIQQTNSNAYPLLYVDNNYLRNCWSVFILIFVIIGIALISWLVTKILTGKQFFKLKKSPQIQQAKSQTNENIVSQTSNELLTSQSIKKQKSCLPLYKRQDADHFQKIKTFCIFVFQNCIIGLIYYSFQQLTTKQWILANGASLLGHKLLAFVFLVMILVYALLRSYTNFLAGIYLFKRVLLSFALFTNPPYKSTISLFLSLLIIEIIFVFFRIYLQCKRDFNQFILFLKDKLNKRPSSQKQQQLNIKDVPPGQKELIDENEMKKQNNFQAQRASINSNLLPLPLRSNMTSNISRFSKKQTQINQTSFKQSKSNQSEDKSKFYSSLSSELKYIFVEETMILVVYLMLSLNDLIPDLTVFLIFLIILVFLVIFADQLIVNLIQYTEIVSKRVTDSQNSLISQLNNKLNINQPKYYFKIRNNFDFEQQVKLSIMYQSSSISARQRKSSINSSTIQSSL